jgi:hypothetical protein
MYKGLLKDDALTLLKVRRPAGHWHWVHQAHIVFVDPAGMTLYDVQRAAQGRCTHTANGKAAGLWRGTHDLSLSLLARLVHKLAARQRSHCCWNGTTY